MTVKFVNVRKPIRVEDKTDEGCVDERARRLANDTADEASNWIIAG